MTAYLRLDAERVLSTADRLRQRVEQRFPDSGLSRVAQRLAGVAGQATERSALLGRPIPALRAGVVALVALILAGLVATFLSLRAPAEPLGVLDFVAALESGINDVIFVAAGIFFLVTLEARIKRHRALPAINELRAIAHIIDMHQLTKDPEWVQPRGPETGHVQRRSLSAFELARYLDYCSEMLSLTGKVAALYVQDLEDDVVLAAVNEVEDLTTGLSQKIWQKLMVLYARLPALQEGRTGTGDSANGAVGP
jgi:hypothetical protein